MDTVRRLVLQTSRQTTVVRKMNSLTVVQGQQWEGQKKIVSRFESALCGTDLLPVSKYLFSVTGKNIRPRIISAMAGAVNAHREEDRDMVEVELKQDLVTQMCEMYHTASLYHDDVIDNADMRRGQPSVPAAWSTKHAVMGGDFVLAVAYSMLAEIDREEVTSCMSRVVKDLVEGELLQMSGKVDMEDNLDLYKYKCYLKTASLIANGCRSVASLSDRRLADEAEQFGREIGIAFQVVDDILDFVSSPEELGKPGGGADILAGIRTAPLILAARQSARLRRMLEEGTGDCEEIVKIVVAEGGLEQARDVANLHAAEALKAVEGWKESESKNDLREIVKIFLDGNLLLQECNF
eukprot:GFUD01008343.1.p1 GENE.GFUD01008343.1~~GFUD01008343.1.p1  ORF type:complete len:352 (-),score=137.07 GFUD01008343.1:145-1200(-)